MGSIAARHARRVLEHSERIIAIELICATQALDLRIELQRGLRRGSEPGRGVAEARARVRAVIDRLEHDRQPGPDLEAAARLVRDGALVDLAEPPPAPEPRWLELDEP
jgi:histidine ammonia-lyase